jgi:hypothetical protein
MLARAQAGGEGQLRVLAGFAVDEIEHGEGRASGVAGHRAGRRLRVRAQTVVLAAGAVCSERLLRKSRLGGQALGRGLSVVVGAQMLADFDEPLAPPADGGATWEPADGGFVLASELPPPFVQAVLMAVPRAEHDRLMRRWRNLASITALVAADRSVAIARGARIDVTLAPQDVRRLVKGLKTAGHVALAAGARRVVAPTLTFREYSAPTALDGLDELIAVPEELRLSTGYPLGGVPMGQAPNEAVVGSDFRVYGVANVYVCDASVLPGSPGVNPQLTIMALGSLASGIASAAQETKWNMAAHAEAGSFSELDAAIQKLEFKVTVLPAEEAKVQAELRRAGVNPTRRKVYFYDTPELALFAKDLVLRARVTDGDDDDSTVKLRPLPLPDVPARWRAADGVRIELDVVGRKRVPSAKLDGEPDRGEIEQVEHGTRNLSELFTEAQEAVVADELPSGISLNNLAMLGPVEARKWDLPPEVFPHGLSVEEWSLPDGTHFIELSFKVTPDEAESAERAFHSLLDRLRIGHDGDPEPKTPRVLEFFAERLRA